MKTWFECALLRIVLAGLTAAVIAPTASAGREVDTATASSIESQELPSAGPRGVPITALQHEIGVKKRSEKALFKIPGVVGVGVGLQDEVPAILVLVHADADPSRIPATLEGVPVRVELAEGGSLLNGGYPNCGGVPCHNEELSLPVQMGNATSSANTCDSGTLGFKACHLDSLSIGYVSANHVAAGTPNARYTYCFNGPIGMQEMHPGNFEDPQCSTSNLTFTNFIGTLLDFVPVNGTGVNPADAAFVESSDAFTQWSIRDIGTPSTIPGTAQLNACVKKSGRTTGLTWGVVTGVNVTWVNRFDRCFSSDPMFGNSILIRGANTGECAASGFSRFAAGGDSGSAVLDTANRIVGLVFAQDTQGIYAVSSAAVIGNLGLSLDAAQCSSTATLLPTADAFIAQEQPTKNFGSSNVLRIRSTSTGFGRYSFLKFQVPAHGGRITSAILRLRVESTVQQAALYRVNNMVWSENTVNWSNWSSSGPTWTFLGNYSNLSPGVWYNLDVTNGVSGAGEITFGIASQNDVGQQDFYSRNSTSDPQLIISYGPQ